MKSSTAKKVVAIYSIVFGLLALFESITGGLSTSSEASSLVFEVVLVVMGVLLLTIARGRLEKVFMIIALVVYSLCALVGLIVMIIVPFFGIVAMLIFVVPFVFTIIYLVSLNHENNPQTTSYTVARSSNESFATPKETVEDKLAFVKRLYDDGLLTSEEYERKRQSIIDRI